MPKPRKGTQRGPSVADEEITTATTATAATTSTEVTLTGGDWQRSLSAVEVDKLCGETIALSSAAFYECEEGTLKIDGLKEQLRLETGEQKLFVVWVRHHWVATELSHDRWIIFDSARSEAVQRSMEEWAKRLGIPRPTFRPCPQQQRDSFECGLFASLFVLMLRAGWAIPAFSGFVSLAKLRTVHKTPQTFLAHGLKILQSSIPVTIRAAGDQARTTSAQGGASPDEPAEPSINALKDYRSGDFITDTLIEYWMHDWGKQTPQLQLWHVVNPVQLHYLVAFNSEAMMPAYEQQQRAACIMFVKHRVHFILVVYDGNELLVYDSMQHGHEVDTPTRRLIVKFWRSFRGDAALPRISFRQCEQQSSGANDCAIRCVNNLIGVVTGRQGILSRTQIKRAFEAKKKSPGDKCNFKYSDEAAKPSVATKAEDSEKQVAVALQSKPSTTVAMPASRVSADESSKTGSRKPVQLAAKPCCSRVIIHANYCQWHHPTLKDSKSKCTATNSLGKPCNDPALMLRGVTTCWTHSLPRQREQVTQALEHGETVSAPKVSCHKPYAQLPQKPASKKEELPLGHAVIRTILRNMPRSAHIVLRLRAEDGKLQDVYGTLTRHATASSPATLRAQHTTCPLCNGLLFGEPKDTRFPLTCCHYYSIRELGSMPDLRSRADCGCALDDASDEDEEDPAGEKSLKELRIVVKPDRSCLNALPSSPITATLRTVLNGCKVLPEQTGVHNLVWNEKTLPTRRQHISIIKWLMSANEEIANAPIGRGCVELVLRRAAERHWSDSTISTKLSALASALNQLSLYTTKLAGFNLKTDLYYSSACTKARRNAEIAALRPRKAAPLTDGQLDQVAKAVNQSPAWVLLMLCWYLAGRVADVRRLLPRNITLAQSNVAGEYRLSALFIAGKGAHFWGPYVIHTRVPESLAQAISGYLATRDPELKAFSDADQARLKIEVAKFPDHSLLSLRKGALVHLARLGVSDDALQMLSGHQRRRTLMRYLGFCRESSSAQTAADEVGRARRAEQEKISGGEEPGSGAAPPQPLAMGTHSGYRGDRGQRIEKPPSLFCTKMPRAKSLGIEVIDEDTSDYTLHCKDIDVADWQALADAVVDPELKTAVAQAISWLKSSSNYGITWAPLVTAQIPKGDFSEAQIRRMLETGKLVAVPSEQLARSACRGFTVPEPAKKRFRPIFVPRNNNVIDKSGLPPLKYPSRRERRTEIAGKRFIATFDFAAWYDQLALSPEVRDCFAIRSKKPIDVEGVNCDTFHLTREPMGSTHSAHVAQTLTWAILEPLFDMDVTLLTMIDNVLIAGNDEEQFVLAVQTFVSRCQRFNITLNDAATIPQSAAEISRWGQMASSEGTTFLGEVHRNGQVSNTDRNIEKFRTAFHRLQQATKDKELRVSRRNVASLVSCGIFLMHTLNLPLREHFDLLRLFGKMERAKGKWDDPIDVTPDMVNAVGRVAGPILENRPVTPFTPPAPSLTNSDYDVVIMVDASSTGYGAFVQIGGELFEVRGGWQEAKRHSAHAEPMAAAHVLRWARSRASGRIAIVSDHAAMPMAQRRPFSGNGGFSKAYFLNEFFREAYAGGDDVQIFFVAGQDNIADAPSRATRIGQQLVATRRDDILLPPLDSFNHPYFNPPRRRWWHV